MSYRIYNSGNVLVFVNTEYKERKDSDIEYRIEKLPKNKSWYEYNNLAAPILYSVYYDNPERDLILDAEYTDFQYKDGSSFSNDLELITYLDKTLGIADVSSLLSGGQIDKFGRIRVSETGQRLDVEFLYDKQEDFFDEVTNNGSITNDVNSRDLDLALNDANNGSYAKMCSYPVPYTPGNSHLIDITGVLDFAAIGGGTAEYFLRSKVTGTVVETTVPQSSWDDLSSGVNWDYSHIFYMAFQSLRVGSIEYGMVVNGAPIKVGQIDNDNIRNTGYWQGANLPVCWRLYNDDTYTYMECGYGDENNAIGFRYKISANASAKMKAICTTVKSEGGFGLDELPGLPRSASNGVTVKQVDNTIIPLLSIRNRSTFHSFPNLGLTLPKSWECETDNPIRLMLIHNGTLTGASWSDVDTLESWTESDVSATAITNGHIIGESYITTVSKNTGGGSGGLLGKTVLWDRQDSLTGILTLAAIRTTTTTADVLAALNWEEIR